MSLWTLSNSHSTHRHYVGLSPCNTLSNSSTVTQHMSHHNFVTMEYVHTAILAYWLSVSFWCSVSVSFVDWSVWIQAMPCHCSQKTFRQNAHNNLYSNTYQELWSGIYLYWAFFMKSSLVWMWITSEISSKGKFVF